ncbi:MAG: uroporphyrinogen-III synthase [Bacteroidetes bacterium]|nr:uroporphyrinogen-III synthase [Bacteroidota bacterium]MDA0903554.1 uroporphyrinogen-III synthase [Bacteroidota bacterium]MDA1242139.1 uroporphyrinogen-III synthase [Bacteroidota bacterium]
MAQKIKTVLISQPKPTTEKSPYFDLAERLNLTIDFRPFIHVEGMDAQEFRQQRIDLASHTAVILTSRLAVDHYFRLAKELRFEVPDSMKYFCISESTAYYLQKYVQFRKRKIFHGTIKFEEVVALMKKHKSETFLLPSSDLLKDSIPQLLDQEKLKYSRAVMYRTVCSDLSDLSDVKYDVLVFFSPSGIESLFKNFPDFVQGETRIAVFGPTTAKAAEEAGLRIDINAPTAKAPSMTMALDQYITR